MADDPELRDRDPLYLIPASWKAKNDQDYAPWMTADVREREGDYKLWLHRYKFFSHALANRREEQHCQFYGSMSKEDTMARGQFAKHAKCADTSEWKTLDPKRYTFEQTMGRIIGNLEEKAAQPKHMTRPLWDKYKYFNGLNGRENLEADCNQQEQDPLHHFKVMDMSVPKQKLKTSSSTLDVAEQAATRVQKDRRAQKSRSQGTLVDKGLTQPKRS
jgi:hypothetical protein